MSQEHENPFGITDDDIRRALVRIPGPVAGPEEVARQLEPKFVRQLAKLFPKKRVNYQREMQRFVEHLENRLGSLNYELLMQRSLEQLQSRLSELAGYAFRLQRVGYPCPPGTNSKSPMFRKDR